MTIAGTHANLVAMSWHVRRTTAEDWEDVRDTRLRSLKDAPDAFGASHDDQVAVPDSVWRERAGTGRIALAYDGGNRPIGIVGSYRASPTATHLIMMWVAPDRRGSGVAQGLVDAVVDQAVHCDAARRVHLWVTETNPAARRLYERLGFKDTGERVPLWSNETVDVLGMQRDVVRQAS